MTVRRWGTSVHRVDGSRFLTDIGAEGRAHVVRARGEIDLGSSDELKRAVAQAVGRERNPVIVDLTAVTFMDSTGLAILLNAQRRLTRQQRALLLVCHDGPVRQLLRLAQLDGTFAVYPTLGDAERAAAAHRAGAPSGNGAGR